MDDGTAVKKRTPLYNHDPYNSVILSDITGIVKFVDMIDAITLQQVTDEQTGHVQKVVIESKDKTLTPSITIESRKRRKENLSIFQPELIYLLMKVKHVTAGTILAKISKSSDKE